MEVTIHRIDFAELMGKVQSIVPVKPSIPTLVNVLIEASDDGEITLSATDLTVSMRAVGKAEVKSSGAIALPARHLFQLIRELTTPEVTLATFESTPQVNGATIEAGSSKFRIQGIDKSTFPNFPDLSEGNVLSFQSEDLRELLTRTAFAAAKDDSRQALNGLLMERARQHATFTGTDGKRLAQNQITIEQTEKGKSRCILPLKAVEEMIKILSEPGERVTLTWIPEKLALECGSATLITKLFSDPYPDVSKVIPEKEDTAIALHRNELISLLRQVSLFTSEKNNSVRFAFDQNSLQLSALSGKIGEGRVSMPVSYNGPKLEIAFNPQSFLDILRHSQDETIKFSVSGSYNPGLITDSSQAKFVIMPMRLEAIGDAESP